MDHTRYNLPIPLVNAWKEQDNQPIGWELGLKTQNDPMKLATLEEKKKENQYEEICCIYIARQTNVLFSPHQLNLQAQMICTFVMGTPRERMLYRLLMPTPDATCSSAYVSSPPPTITILRR